MKAITKVVLVVVLTLYSAPFALALEWNPPNTYPANFDYWVEWADREYLANGQNQMAMNYYQEAYGIANQQRDPQRIGSLADRYLLARSQTMARNVFAHARDMALDYAKSQNPRERNYGLSSLRFLANLYNNTLRFLPNSAELKRIAEDAIINAQQIDSRPLQSASSSRTNVIGGIQAVAKKNGLEGSWPTRGFGDSNQVDRWIPFSFSFAVPGNIAYAKLKYWFKPIGQLVHSDTLEARGASGKRHILYDQYQMLTGDKWYEHTILINDPDLVAALQKGSLDCIFQDDTALWKAELEIYYR